MVSASSFLLRKWYIDAADTSGNVYIGYWISLKWSHLTFHGYQHFWRSAANNTRQLTKFSKIPEPRLTPHQTIEWKTPETMIRWDSPSAPLEQTLFKSSSGTLQWNCINPKSPVTVTLPHHSFRGMGYVEHITATIPPWKFPFKTLWWGRAHSRNHYIVWIKWDGDDQQNLLWIDGRLTKIDIITNTLVKSDSVELHLTENTTLKRGPIMSAFQPLDRILSKVPRSVFSVREHKKYGTGNLKIGKEVEHATAIYETVNW